MKQPFEIMFYSEEDLLPYQSPCRNVRQPLVSPQHIARLDAILSEIDHAKVEIPKSEPPEVLTQLVTLDCLGGVDIQAHEAGFTISSVSRIATNFSRTYLLYLKHRFPMVSDWYHLAGAEGHICGIDLLLYMERNRIKYSVESGFRPEVFLNKNVSFAIIKGRSQKRNTDVYLLQMNKDWHRYNFIGGKQESCDRCDFRRTMLREAQEELHIDAGCIRISELTPEPILSYGMTGHNGALCSYHCMLYQAFFIESLPDNQRNIWLTEDEILAGRGKNGQVLMINPYYRDFLAKSLSGGLTSLPYSFSRPIDSSTFWNRSRSFLVEHRMLIIAIITILGALIALIKVVI